MNVQRRQDEFRILDLLQKENGLKLEDLCRHVSLNFHHVQRLIYDFRSAGFNINIKEGAVLLEDIPELSKLHYVNEIMEGRGKKTKIFGKNTMVFDTIPSTNDFTYRLGFNEPIEGTVVVAGEQTSGKGRKGAKWYSPRGGLWFSTLLYPEIEPGSLHRLTLMTSLSVSQTLREMFHLNAMIKWPNDVVVEGKKICGILTEAKISGFRTDFVVIGEGLNLNLDEFDNLENVTSVQNELGYKVDLYEVFESLMVKLDENYIEIFD